MKANIFLRVQRTRRKILPGKAATSSSILVSKVVTQNKQFVFSELFKNPQIEITFCGLQNSGFSESGILIIERHLIGSSQVDIKHKLLIKYCN